MNAAAALLLSLIVTLAPAPDGWLGVFLKPDATPQIAEVVPGSPADNAGIKAGDRVLAIDDRAVASKDALIDAIRACKPGQRVKLKLQRNGSEMTVVVQLGERPEEGALPQPQADPQPQPQPQPQSQPEPELEPTPPPPPPPEPQAVTATARPFVGIGLDPVEGGLRVTRVVDGSPAAGAGIVEDDVLVKWGGTAIADVAGVERELQRCKPGDTVALQLRSDGGVKSVLLVLGRAPGETAAPRAADASLDRDTVFGTDLAAAQASGKPVLVLFGAAWNGAAVAQRRAFAADSVRELLDGCECVFVDTDRHGKLAEAHAVQELPQLEWMVDGKTVAKQVGYLPPPELAQWLRQRRAEPAEAAPGGDTGDVAAQLRQIRAELRELRRMLEQMRRD